MDQAFPFDKESLSLWEIWFLSYPIYLDVLVNSQQCQTEVWKNLLDGYTFYTNENFAELYKVSWKRNFAQIFVLCFNKSKKVDSSTVAYFSGFGTIPEISRGCFPEGIVDGCLMAEEYLTMTLPVLLDMLLNAEGGACFCSEDFCNDALEFQESRLRNFKVLPRLILVTISININMSLLQVLLTIFWILQCC